MNSFSYWHHFVILIIESSKKIEKKSLYFWRSGKKRFLVHSVWRIAGAFVIGCSWYGFGETKGESEEDLTIHKDSNVRVVPGSAKISQAAVDHSFKKQIEKWQM